MKAQGRWRCSNAQVCEYPFFRNTDVTNPFIPVAPVLLRPQILRPVKIHTAQMTSAGTFYPGFPGLRDVRVSSAGQAEQTRRFREGSGPCTCAAQMAINLPFSYALAFLCKHQWTAQRLCSKSHPPPPHPGAVGQAEPVLCRQRGQLLPRCPEIRVGGSPRACPCGVPGRTFTHQKPGQM